MLADRLNVTLTSELEAMSELDKAVEGLHDSDLGTTASGPSDSAMAGAAAHGQQPAPQPASQPNQPPTAVQQQIPQPVQLQPAVVPNAVLPGADQRSIVEQFGALLVQHLAPLQEQVQRLQATVNAQSAEQTANKVRLAQTDRRVRDTATELGQKVDSANKKFKTMNARVKNLSKHLTHLTASRRRGRTPSPPFSPVPSDQEEDSSDDPDAMSISRGGQAQASEPQGQAGGEQAGEQEQQQQPAAVPQQVQQQVQQAMSPAPQAALPPPPQQQQQQQLPRQVSPEGNRGSGAGHASPESARPDPEVVQTLLVDAAERTVHGPPPLATFDPTEGLDMVKDGVLTELGVETVEALGATRHDLIKAVLTIHKPTGRHLMKHPEILKPGSGKAFLDEPLVLENGRSMRTNNGTGAAGATNNDGNGRYGGSQQGSPSKRLKFGGGRQQLQGKWQAGRPQNMWPQDGRQQGGWQMAGGKQRGYKQGGYQGGYQGNHQGGGDPGAGPSGSQPVPCRYCGDPFTRDHQRYCRNWPRRDNGDGK